MALTKLRFGLTGTAAGSVNIGNLCHTRGPDLQGVGHDARLVLNARCLNQMFKILHKLLASI